MGKLTRKMLIWNTLEFIIDHVDINGKTVLDVGCGDGLLSWSMMKMGARVLGVESDPREAIRAMENGFATIITDFLEFDSNDKFDIILFSKSLHHINDLQQAINKAAELLKPAGKLILEEFDIKNVDSSTLNWYYKTKQKNISNFDGKKIWMDEHDHNPPLNSGDQMIKAVANRFEIIYSQRCPYLFRSVANDVQDNQAGYRITKTALEEESILINNSKILPVGLRVIGIRK